MSKVSPLITQPDKSGPASAQKAMTSSQSAKMHSEEFLAALMRRQFRLSALCAGSFLVALLGLPLANYFFPELMAIRVWGFTLTWLLLGVGFFPLVWVIAWVFIRRSMQLEENEVNEIQSHRNS